MTLERRSFLKVFSAGATAAVLRPYGWAIRDDGAYFNAAFGLALSPPAGWYFATRVDYEIIADGLRLKGGEKAKAAVLELAGRPLLAISRDRPFNNDEGVSPMIVVWVQQNDASVTVEPTFSHRASYTQYAEYMDDFVFVEDPTNHVFAGLPCSRCVVEYTEEHENVARLTVRNASHLVRGGEFWFTFNLVDAAEGWEPSTRKAFEEFEASVRILPPLRPGAQ